MRRLLIKLVAIETALVGWLAYWLFLVYANNPSVAEGLGSQLSKFPQLAFTTVDLTVLVIIAVLSIVLAFKFQRGMKPGIRLERALQMLENLMKRNLILEAQVAEMKLDRAQVSATPPTLSPAEPRIGSWEKAFRTPIEAGPPTPNIRPPSLGASEPGFEHDSGDQHPPPPRAEPKPLPSISLNTRMTGSEKPLEKTSTNLEKPFDKTPTSSPGKNSSPTWEDNPKFLGETSGIFTPSEPPRKQAISISDSTSHRQPYIPVPVPKTVPSSVILGPGISPIPTAKPLPRPSPPKTTSQKPGPIVPPTPVVTIKPPTPQTSSSTEITKQSTAEKAQTESTTGPAPKDDSEATPKPGGKNPAVKKRFPWEDN